ncbi:heparan-alpha-glucosaminide N-acetyltransferase [Brucella sp. IR073]|uniref:heparan-alpha-glucosaminide N-acetyltransferase n=1 Tax=unclassified Brucella TaxID=2632610 RepID=UPI003B97D6F5
MQLEQTAAGSHPATKQRLARIDIARGVALLAMVIYHGGWDFEFFGYLDPGTTGHGGWKLFARMIASSFLVLAGFSLVLAHEKGIRWKSFGIRLAEIAGAALAITLVTWYLMPGSFIFFGILHQIALASLLGLLFLWLPISVIIVCAAAIIALPFYYQSPLFDHPALWWVGLSTVFPRSNDYVPLFPWFGAVLTGMALARIFQRFQLMPILQNGTGIAAIDRPLTFIGRHSLAFYLTHQPILISCVFLIAQIFPPSMADQHAKFIQTCEQSCQITNDGQFCRRFCSCVTTTLDQTKLFDELFQNRISTESPEIRGIANMCTKESETTGN